MSRRERPSPDRRSSRDRPLLARVADALEDDAQVVSNSQGQHLAADEPAEVVQINTDANHAALKVALLVPSFASLIGLFNLFRMMRLPEIKPAANLKAASLG